MQNKTDSGTTPNVAPPPKSKSGCSDRLIEPHEPAYTNLLAMSDSVQRTYTLFYLDAKSDKTRQTRMEKIIDRLNKNLKPM
ncbi:YdeI/OmpD-associated family protein [Bacteroides salyersiae]|nr:YdeI/OmpD-associated family protein [Bacteroides salyersiae]